MWKRIKLLANLWKNRKTDDALLAKLQAQKKAYEVSTEEARTGLECVNRLASWKGEIGHA
jgi:hypothetical protein